LWSERSRDDENRAPERFLRAGVDAASVLAELHETVAVVGDLTPAWLGGREPGPSEAWAYRSPEQTGLLQRPVDGRSDLYSLGVILYELLTGQLPFEAADPLEWAHRHLAMPPRSPRDEDPRIPETVDQIVLRLLEKDPEDRYQTADGLRRDLERCLEQWERAQSIAPFALGECDRTERIVIPEKLYDRDRERLALLNAFALVRDGGGPRVVPVVGEPGMGKSLLVRDLGPAVAAAGGLLVSGKFEDTPRGAPFAPIVGGFGDLVALILAGQEEALAVWRRRLQLAVADNGRIITDLLPQLELVIGPQATVATLPPGEALHRFVGTFSRFVGVFATPEHPLVMLLDDLQWADPASLRLVSALAAERSLRSLLVVGAYRGNLSPSHPLARVLEELRDTGAPTETVELGPLGAEPLTELLAETLKMDPGMCEPLQEMLSAKTAGNPLFFTQLLLELRGANFVRFDRDALTWRWDSDGIREAPVSANVAALLKERLTVCPPETQQMLGLAACLGGGFDAELLARVGAGEREETARMIETAVRAGLVIRSHDGYHFSHDRVREAAYATIATEDRLAMHLRIGHGLLANGADLFEAVGQLDHGRSLIVQPGERRELARLNWEAAQRARGAAAFDAVSEYCGAGLELLGSDGWTSERELMFALTRERAETELFAGNLEEAERLLTSATAHARSRLERTQCARVGLDLKATAGANVEALELAIDVLRTYGLDVSLHPRNVGDVERAMWQRLGGRPIEAVTELPRGDDPEVGAALDLLARAGPHGYITDRELHRLLACVAIDLTLQHGAYAPSAWGLAAYGLELSARERYAEGDRFAEAALGLIDRHGFVSYKAFVCTLLAEDVWTRDLHVAAEIARDGIRAGSENGDVLGAGFCWQALCCDRFAAGDPLLDVERDVDEGVEFARRVRFSAQADTIILLRQLIRALTGRTDRLTALTDTDVDERTLQASLERHAVTHIDAWLLVHSLQAQVFGGDFAAAAETSTKLGQEALSLPGPLPQVDAAFFGALAIAGCATDVRRARLDQLRTDADRLAAWAELCPQNLSHKAALLAGEVARADDRPAKALELFALATAHAQTHRFVHVEALAHESAARLCREQGLKGPGEAHIGAARECYRRWGATGKVTQLEGPLPFVAQPSAHPREQTLDALAVTKASQAISGEVVHERVLERLLQTVIEQAGARGGVLLLCRHEQAVVAATADSARTGVAVTVHVPPLEPSPEVVAEAVINYVMRTKEPLIISDAAAQNPFASDPYVVRRRLRSMLCIPILSHRELRGVVCLENDLIADAFTKERLPALEVLTAQAVISLENASLYGELRREIAERERYERELQHLADHDPLTGLFNRRRFREELDRELARARRSGIPGAVLLIDLDHFKYVNDSLGHSIGDQLIAQAGGLLARRARAMDLLARIGGDEFALILPDVTEHEAELVAHALLKVMRQELWAESTSGSRPVTASIGVAAFSAASELSADELLVEADIAMYDAKEAGRGRASVYSASDEHRERMQARLTWDERIRGALRENRLVLHAQSIVPLNEDAPPCHELLVRMLDDDGTLIEPAAFLPIAERMDLIDRIDRWVARQAVRLLAREQRAGHDVRLQVNLSAVLLGDEELPAFIAGELHSAGADGHGLCFEITETAAIINMERARQFASGVAKLGCQLALDDFGTGFASFYYLKHLPFDYLKIDGEFIRELPNNPTDQLVVKSIAEIAHGLGKRTVAEFVSNQHTLELLRGYGVDYAQGFFVGRPGPIPQTGLA
jgi:diguanylate cyclase (GGDEF)-like protein